MRNLLQLGYGLCLGLIASGPVGCGSGSLPPAAERLPGKWQGQMIVYEDTVAGKLTPQQISELAQKQMNLEFAANGSMVTSAEINGQATASSGRWELVSQEGDLLKIKSTEQSGKSKDINIEFEDADTFYIPLQTEVAELGAMKFTRMR